jgi:hypothetical protein
VQPLVGDEERKTKLAELESAKVRLFEELGRVAEVQKRLAAEMRRVEKDQRAELRRAAEYVAEEPLSHGDVERWAESVYWSHARTMLGNPHQYANRKRCAHPKMYERVVAHVLAHGRPQVYGGHTYTVYDFHMHGESYFCWPMTDDPRQSQVLNAKPASMAPEKTRLKPG